MMFRCYFVLGLSEDYRATGVREWLIRLRARQNNRLCVSPMQMTGPPMFNLPSHSNLIYRVSESSGEKKSTTPETIVSQGTKRVLSNLCRDVATEVGCSARLVLVQPMAGWAANLQSELDGFEQRNVALHLIIPELRDFKKKILPGHMSRTIQGARFQEKKRATEHSLF